jgi:DNA invertase Pin-like site-specific DNA recombinase
MSKVYGYCRVAVACKEEITEQRALIDIYCRHHGLEVDKYFCDNGVSGLNSYRNGLNEMLYILQEGDVVVVKDVARLSRDMKQCMSFMELMEQLGVTVKTVR